jgi:MFS transporter, DHA1 family, multidrug resistance protein
VRGASRDHGNDDARLPRLAAQPALHLDRCLRRVDGANFIFPFIPFYLQELGVEDPAQVALLTGITASATGLSLTLTAPFWGSLSDRVGRKPMLMRALIGAGVLIALMGLANAVWQLVLLRFFMGAFAGTMGAAAALVAATTPRERTGSALGILQTGMFVANMLGPVIGGVVSAALGLRESFIFCAILYVIASALVYFFVREPGREELVAGPDGVKPKRPQTGIIENLRIVLKERQVLFILGFLYVP